MIAMNWQPLIPYAPLIALPVTTFVAILGWLIAHWLTSKRDQANKHREIRLQYLIEAYRRLGDASARQLSSATEHAQGLESALADIQLFGSTSQVEKLEKFFENYSAEGNAYLDDVINDLRDELRKVLDLPPIPGNIQWMRFRQTPNKLKR